MRGSEFIRRVRRYAKTQSLRCDWHADLGKGSHGLLVLGNRIVFMREFVYPARLSTHEAGDGFVVSFRDIPEAITQGDTREDALEAAAGALQAALEGRIMSDLDIPPPSRLRRGERMVPVPIKTALKAALHLEMRRSGITRAELARRLRIDEREARRMLDPRHPSKADRLEQALAVLGKHAELRIA